jgi:hypothetical protein
METNGRLNPPNIYQSISSQPPQIVKYSFKYQNHTPLISHHSSASISEPSNQKLTNLILAMSRNIKLMTTGKWRRKRLSLGVKNLIILNLQWNSHSIFYPDNHLNYFLHWKWVRGGWSCKLLMDSLWLMNGFLIKMVFHYHSNSCLNSKK